MAGALGPLGGSAVKAGWPANRLPGSSRSKSLGHMMLTCTYSVSADTHFVLCPCHTLCVMYRSERIVQ